MKNGPPPDQVVVPMDRINSKSPDKYSPHLFEPNTPRSPHPCSDEKPTTNPKSTATRPLSLSLPLPKPKSRFAQYSSYPQPAAAGDKPNSSDEEKDEETDEDEDEFFEEKQKDKYPGKKRKVRWGAIAERATLVVILAVLVTSLTAEPLKRRHFWGLVVWKWVLLVMVVFSGRLVSTWLVWVLAFLIERNFMLREKVVYFVYGLRKSVRNCIWLGLVLLTWYVTFNPEVEGSTHAHSHRFRKRVLRVLIAVTIGAVIWLLKIILVKVLASSFHVSTFFERMQWSVFHHMILEKLSGPPLDAVSPSADPSERKKTMGRTKNVIANGSSRIGNRSWRMEKLRLLSQKKPSAYTVKRLVSHVMYSGLSSISTTVDQTMEDFREIESDMTKTELEREARMCALRIFKNVAKEGEKCIEEDDLLRFLEKDEVNTFLPCLPGAQENRKIRKSAFRNWVVEAYRERQALACSLNDTKTAVQQLHKLASAVVIIIIIIMSLLVMGVASTKVLLVVSSQLVLVAFMFGNTCKTIFESIIFVFVMHPFDTGDRCVIDGVQMIVEEMNILTTVFMRYDNEKIYFPNSVLLTKPISNFQRSPPMGDTIEFAIDAATKVETFTDMKDEIKKYIEKKPKYWQPKHHVVVKEIENVNKMKVVLFFAHTINYQEYIEKLNRRSELVIELKKIFEKLQIKYHLLPQQVQLVGEKTGSGLLQA